MTRSVQDALSLSLNVFEGFKRRELTHTLAGETSGVSLKMTQSSAVAAIYGGICRLYSSWMVLQYVLSSTVDGSLVQYYFDQSC